MAASEPTTSPLEIKAIKPFIIATSSELNTFQVTKQQYLDQNQNIQHVVCSAFHFYNNRLLLVQRSEADSWPLRWEIPGGSCDFQDESLLHAAARELFEETGLHVTKINHQVGTGMRFATGSGPNRKQWIKFSFDVDVEEACADQEHIDSRIKLDSREHSDWTWATRDEIEAGQVGDVVLRFVGKKAKDEMLEACAMRDSMERSRSVL